MFVTRFPPGSGGLSLAFGDGAGFDSCSIYATSLRFGGATPDLYRVRVGVPDHKLWR